MISPIFWRDRVLSLMFVLVHLGDSRLTRKPETPKPQKSRHPKPSTAQDVRLKGRFSSRVPFSSFRPGTFLLETLNLKGLGFTVWGLGFRAYRV